MDNLHLVIFCGPHYKDYLLDHCVYCIEQNVQDKFVSRTIVADLDFEYPGFDIVTDQEIWDQIDPDFTYKKLFQSNWARQQILKLSVDKIKTGKVLIVDADLFFLKPIRFVVENKYNIYTSSEDDYFKPYFDTVKFLINKNKIYSYSFVTDFALFDCDILAKLKTTIEQHTHTNWVDAINTVMLEQEDHSNYFGQGLSEFELYGTYLYSEHFDKINSIIHPTDYQTWINLDIKLPAKETEFLDYLRSKSKNYFQSVWFKQNSFKKYYADVRDLSWPECDHESKFHLLPKHIQQECIELHNLQEFFPYLKI